MTISDVLEAFQLTQAHSIYEFSPVYKAWHTPSQQWCVLKQTRNTPATAQALQNWLQALAQSRKPGDASRPCCVQALSACAPNPRTLAGDSWVVYPFLAGIPYTATPAQLHQAGELLGKMHALTSSSPENLDFGLPHYDWPEQDAESLKEDHEGLQQLRNTLRDKLSHKLTDKRSNPHDQQPDTSLKEEADITTLQTWLSAHPTLRQQLMEAPLRWAPVSWDYKANNLIFDATQNPVLIDPDSGGYLPRLLDLALAVWLFHNELPTAPARPFSATEWQTFYTGYTRHIQLTSQEKALWPAALKWMFLEEALWLLLNDTEAWEQPHSHQGQFLHQLIRISEYPHLFALPHDEQ